MDQGGWAQPDVDAYVATAPEESPDEPSKPRRRAPLWVDLTLLGVVAVVLIIATAAAIGAIYKEFYSPSAFVDRYLSLLSAGRAADALAVPGVKVDSAELETAGLPPTAHDALLRRAAIAPLTDVHVVKEQTDAELTLVTVQYRAGDVDGTSTLVVERDGSIGIVPTWRFAVSPLAVLQVTVTGSRQFAVNGFEMDERQVSPDGVDADPDAPVSLLVFSPGLYSVTVDTPLASTPGVAVLSDTPFSLVPASVRAEPTPQFESVVQQRVEEYLNQCATQEVLQPTACPFGYTTDDRLIAPPVWSIAQQPAIELVPTRDGWRIPPVDAVAHIEVEVRSLFDGSVRQVSEDVPFAVSAEIAVLPDGSATITVGDG